MKVGPKLHRTQDGHSYQVRSAKPADAGRISDFARLLHGLEPEVNLPESDEVVFDAESIARAVRAMAAAPNSLFLLAEAGGELIGTLTLRGGRYKKLRHTAEMGITVRKGWRGRGVASRLMETMLETAAGSGVLDRITLTVFSSNESALRLYERFGFREEGRQPGQIRIAGRPVDLLFLGRTVSDPPPPR